MIRQLQKVMYKERYIACELDYPMDYVKYAECFGIEAESVSTQDEFAEALKKHSRTAIIRASSSLTSGAASSNP